MPTSRKLPSVMMVTLRPISVDLWTRFKAQAALENVPLYQLLSRVVSDYLKNAKGAK